MLGTVAGVNQRQVMPSIPMPGVSRSWIFTAIH
jgi:hypothetical protein